MGVVKVDPHKCCPRHVYGNRAYSLFDWRLERTPIGAEALTPIGAEALTSVSSKLLSLKGR